MQKKKIGRQQEKLIFGVFIKKLFHKYFPCMYQYISKCHFSHMLDLIIHH